MNFSKCWLDYKPLTVYEQEWLLLAVDCEGDIVNSAVREYQLAMKAMTGKEPEIVLAPAASGVNLEVDVQSTLGCDGYSIKSKSRICDFSTSSSLATRLMSILPRSASSVMIPITGSISFCFESGFPSLTARLKWIARWGITITGRLMLMVRLSGWRASEPRSITRPATDSGRSNQV